MSQLNLGYNYNKEKIQDLFENISEIELLILIASDGQVFVSFSAIPKVNWRRNNWKSLEKLARLQLPKVNYREKRPNSFQNQSKLIYFNYF